MVKIYSNCGKRPPCLETFVRYYNFKHQKYYKNRIFLKVLIINIEFLACLHLHNRGQNCRLTIVGNIYHSG